MGTRQGQQTFRRRLLKREQKKCEVTLCSLIFALDSCHIKPYCECDDEEKMDPHNAILLLSSIHKTLDAGYIGFDDDGRILISSELDNWELACLGLTGKERIRMPGKRKEYFAFHRERKFRP